MELTSWLALAAICVMGPSARGPAWHRSSAHGAGRAGHGVATALGHGLGVGIYALITALGPAIPDHPDPAVVRSHPLRRRGVPRLARDPLRGQACRGCRARRRDIRPRGRQGRSRAFMGGLRTPARHLLYRPVQPVSCTPTPAGVRGIMMLTAGGIDAPLVCAGGPRCLSRGPVLAWLKAKSTVILTR